MTTYAGDPNAFPLTFPLISDAGAPAGSDLNVPLSALADRTAYLKAQTDDLSTLVRQQRLLNWGNVVTLPALSTYPVAAVHQARNVTMVAGGSTPKAYALRGCGDSPVNLLASIAVPGDEPTDVAASDNGEFVIACGRYLYFVTNLLVPQRVDMYGAALSAPAPNQTAVAFASGSGMWIWAGSTGAAFVVRRTGSPTSPGWSAGGVPAGWPVVFTSLKMAVRKDTGAIMMVVNIGSATIKTAISTDAGATWTNRADITPLTPGSFPDMGLSFDQVSGAWLLSNSLSTGGNGEVLRSIDNGATWTRVWSGYSVGRVAADEYGTLVATRFDRNIAPYNGFVYSANGGTTWKSCSGAGPSGLLWGRADMYFSGNGFVSVGANAVSADVHVISSMRAGLAAGLVF